LGQQSLWVAVARIRTQARTGDSVSVDVGALSVTFYYAGHNLPLEPVDLRATELALDEPL
jgi:hypothetical protein